MPKPIKAKLNPVHPLATGLRGAWPFLEGVGTTPENAVTPGETFLLSGPTGWKVIGGDLAVKFGAGLNGITNRPFPALTGDITISVLVNFSALPTGTEIILELSENTNSHGDAWGIFADSGIIAGFRRVGGIFSEADVPAALGTHLYTFVHAVGVTALGWRDGFTPQSGGAVSVFHPVTWGSYPLYIGGRGTTSLFFSQAILGVWIWERRLPLPEIRYHALDPFSMFEAPSVPFLFEAAAIIPPPPEGEGLPISERSLATGLTRTRSLDVSISERPLELIVRR